MIISDKLQKQIIYLCGEVPREEWSGVLFFSVKGEFRADDFEITAEEVFPMDIGTGTYTEYDPSDPALIKYMMTNPRVMDMKRGHIHSHNTMSVFFSGTDDSELITNCPHHNYYVSLIVNNANDMCAKVAFNVVSTNTTVTKSVIKYMDGNGVEKTEERPAKEDQDETQECYAYVCEITKPHQTGVEDTFKSRFQEIKEEKRRPSFSWGKGSTTYGSKSEGGGAYGGFNVNERYQAGLYDDNDTAVGGDTPDESTETLEEREEVTPKTRKREKWNPKTFRYEPEEDNLVEEKTVEFKFTPSQEDIKRFLVRWLSQDTTANDILYDVLSTLNYNYFKEKVTFNAKANQYFDDIVMSSAVYYNASFGRKDPQMLQFDYVIDQCKNMVKHHKYKYKQLYAGLEETFDKLIEENGSKD